MNTDNDDRKLKEILNNMNTCEINLDGFYELMEKEIGGKLTFSKFKDCLERSYPTINKCKFYFK